MDATVSDTSRCLKFLWLNVALLSVVVTHVGRTCTSAMNAATRSPKLSSEVVYGMDRDDRVFDPVYHEVRPMELVQDLLDRYSCMLRGIDLRPI